MLRLIARKTGFLFLGVSLLLAAVLLVTIISNLQVWGPNITLIGESGAIHAYILIGASYSSNAGIRASARSVHQWNWRTSQWPRYRHYVPRLQGTEKHYLSIPIWILILASLFASWLMFLIARAVVGPDVA